MLRIDERTVNTVRGVLLAVGLVLSVGMTVPDVGPGEQDLVDSSESATSWLSPVPLTDEGGVGYVPDRPDFERIGDASADVVQNAGLAQPDSRTGFFCFTPCLSDLQCSGGCRCFNMWGETYGVCL